MRDTPVPVYHRDVIRYFYAIVVIASISGSVLVGWVFARSGIEIRSRDEVERFHVRSAMLSSQILNHVGRLERLFHVDGRGLANGRGGGADLATLDRRVSIALASIVQTLASIDLLHEKYGVAEFAGTLDRVRRRYARLAETLSAAEEPTDRVLANFGAFAVSVRQLHKLHSIALEDALAQMSASTKRLAWQFLWSIAAVLVVTGIVLLRLLSVVRARLHRQTEIEEALRERERQLQHSQKIQALGTFVGGVAHDFNNILTAVVGHAQILQMKLASGGPGAENTDEILKAGERAVSLTRQLLTFSRYEPVQRGLVDLNPALLDMQPLLLRLMREDVLLDLDLAEAVGMVQLDRLQLEQIMMNFATNACDAMPDGGKLSIQTVSVDVDVEEAASRGMESGRYSCIRVEDSGCGFSLEVRSRVFEPFFTTKDRGKGTGLGLATVHGIVTGIGGHVIVDSEVGRGTRFDVYLPHEDRREEDAAKNAEEQDGLRGTETVMLVEDDDAVQELSAEGLREQGYRVLVTASGVEALRVCREYPDPIHLILTDVVLPGLRGPEVVEQVRETRPNIAAVYMSGYTDEDILAKVLVSTDSLLEKPFKLQELLRVVRQQADRFRERQKV